jgi:uncharacterized membrane protein
MREFFLVIHFIGLAMGLGTSFGFMFLGIAGSKMDKAEGIKFSLNTMALTRMGHIGLVLLIISGGGLMTPYWDSLATMPKLITKLVLVLVLATLIGIMTSMGKKARASGDPEAQLKKIRPLGMLAMLTAITIVILAVLVFR